MKNLLNYERNGDENRKIIDIIDEKTFQPGLRTKKEKPRLVERGGTCLRKDLVRIRCCAVFPESNCQQSTTMQALWHYPYQRNRSPATCQLLALKNRTDLDFSLSPHITRFLARFVNCFRFCFAESWIVGLAMGGAESKDADVIVGFFGWSL